MDETRVQSPTPFRSVGDSANKTRKKPRVKKIGSLVSQLMSRRGYAQITAAEQLQQLIETVVSDSLHSSFQVGNLRGGVLHIFVTDSVTLQELNFQKRSILRCVQKETTFQNVVDLRFRIQS